MPVPDSPTLSRARARTRARNITSSYNMVRHETSYGIIPLQNISGEWQVLLVFHEKGHWAFPKGHANQGEKEQGTAERELKEETGLSIVRFLDLPPFKEHYFFHDPSDLIDKTVIYWVAEVAGEIKLQEAEIADCKWLSLKEAPQWATFPQTKNICTQLYLVLEGAA